MRKAFTLIEVNLAMLIMATGILTVVGLYAFGYRENRQSREDVAATAFADAVVGQLLAAVTSTNLTWTTFNNLQNYPGDQGWGHYFDSNGIVSTNPESMAEGTFAAVMGVLESSLPDDFDTKFPSSAHSKSGLDCGLVVRHDPDSAIVRIGFRATKLPGALLSMPLYYCEGRFQGDPNK